LYAIKYSVLVIALLLLFFDYRINSIYLIFSIILELFALFVFQGRLSASGVGSLVGLQSEQIQNIAAHYADKVLLFLFLEIIVQ